MNKLLKSIYENVPVFLQNTILSGYSYHLDRQRYGGAFHSFHQLLSKTEWYSTNDIINYQNENMIRIVNHAYQTVPYYRRVFSEKNLLPSDIKSIDDLPKLPVLTKNDIKQNFYELVSSDYNLKQVYRGHTSGTTGSPLEVCYDQNTVNVTYAALDRQYRWADCKLARDGNRIAVVRGNTIVPLTQKKKPFWRYNYFHNQLLLSSFHMSAENLKFYFQELNKYRPEVIDGYPSTLYVLAKYLQNIDEKFLVKAVISSSETLYDFQRDLIEERFDCRIFDYYALAERVIFSTECEKHEGHHFNMEYGIHEVVDERNLPRPKGEVGKLLGTSLHNFAMPLIRYVTDDMTAVKKSACSCGRGLELMEDVTTKAEDTLTLKDGRLISPSVLTHPFKPLTSIEASQIVQKDYDYIIVKIIPKKEYNPSDSQKLIDALHERIGSDTIIELEFVDRLPRTANGKFRWVISEVELGI